MSKIGVIGGIGFVGSRRKLVSSGVADVFDQLAKVVIVFGELLTQLIQQRLINRWIADANIIDLIDDAFTKKCSRS